MQTILGSTAILIMGSNFELLKLLKESIENYQHKYGLSKVSVQISVYHREMGALDPALTCMKYRIPVFVLVKNAEIRPKEAAAIIRNVESKTGYTTVGIALPEDTALKRVHVIAAMVNDPKKYLENRRNKQKQVKKGKEYHQNQKV